MEEKVKRARGSHVGLCSTCDNDRLCTFPRKTGIPVIECLEFNGGGLDTITRGAGTAMLRKNAARHKREPGLCPLCDKRLACTFQKSPGGVWRCEEFV